MKKKIGRLSEHRNSWQWLDQRLQRYLVKLEPHVDPKWKFKSPDPRTLLVLEQFVSLQSYHHDQEIFRIFWHVLQLPLKSSPITLSKNISTSCSWGLLFTETQCLLWCCIFSRNITFYITKMLCHTNIQIFFPQKFSGLHFEVPTQVQKCLKYQQHTVQRLHMSRFWR